MLCAIHLLRLINQGERVLAVWNLAVDFETHRQSVVAHAHHPGYPIVEIFPAHLEPGTLLRLLDELTADQNHSAFRRFPWKRQFALPYVVLLLYD